MLQLLTEAELVVHDHVLETLDASFELLDPYRRAGEFVGRRDVVHEETIDVADGRVLVEIGRHRVGVPWLGAAVPTDVQVVARLSHDQSDVLGLGLGALPHAFRDRALDLVRGADPAVALLDADGEADRILDSVPAPGRPDAALVRP